LGEGIEFLCSQRLIHSMDESTAIIGGADGPTVLMVASVVNPLEEWFFAAIAAIAAGIGIYKTRRNV